MKTRMMACHRSKMSTRTRNTLTTVLLLTRKTLIKMLGLLMTMKTSRMASWIKSLRGETKESMRILVMISLETKKTTKKKLCRSRQPMRRIASKE